MYHVNDLRQFIGCPRMYFLERENTEEKSFNQYLRNDTSVSELLIKLFKIDNPFIGERNDRNERFFDNIDNHQYFLMTRFDDEGMRIKVPLLKKVNNQFEAYFLLYKTNNKEIDLFTLRVTLAVLKSLNVDIVKAYTISFNPDYVFHNELDVNQLFIVSDCVGTKDLLALIKEKDIDYKEIIRNIEAESGKEHPPLKSRSCHAIGTCRYYDECFKEEAELPDDNILTLVSSKYKTEMYERGLKTLKDADLEYVEGNRVQYAQIRASENGGLFVEKPALKHWLEKLNTKPISFIDFEWDRYLVPVYENMHPFDVVCFEFALYYIDENGKIEHRTFIGTHDCRKEFIEAMIEYLPESGPILAYNADGAEVLRLKELSVAFPEYADKLNAIIERFVDLAIPFIEGIVYDTRMRGNFTVKKLVSIVSEYSYKDLEVGDGMEAVYSWRDIDKGISSDEDKALSELREYCSLDAYSLFLVYKWLVELAVS